MNKELFVSATPHETKVGITEDDQLAEIYLERENEYTLAGSIYKGRVTRVLPGMQSAFVDIGLERDAFLYVSDFMDLEQQDEDLDEAIPANRPAGESRPRGTEAESPSEGPLSHAGGASAEAEEPASGAPGNTTGGGRDFRGRRRRRGRRGEVPTEPRADVGNEASSEPRAESSYGGARDPQNEQRNEPRSSQRPEHRPEPRSEPRNDRFSRGGRSSRTGSDSRFQRTPPSTTRVGRDYDYGPPPGYQPIVLPGESISKYQRQGLGKSENSGQSEGLGRSDARNEAGAFSVDSAASAEPQMPAAIIANFPDDEPIFAEITEPLHEQHEHVSHAEVEEEAYETTASVAAESDFTSVAQVAHEHSAVEEQEIEEEEADLTSYGEEPGDDDGFEELEEETRAAGEIPQSVAEDAALIAASDGEPAADGEAVTEAVHEAEGQVEAEVEAEEREAEELELEEAQAEAEALLEAEAIGAGTLDASAEVRGPAPEARLLQRTQRRGPERGFDRGRGRRGGGRRFRSRENTVVPQISELLKEGQEILIQIAKEPIAKKGARITSHIALPGRFLVFMPTVNHTGVSRKISSEEERQRLKRIIQSERENGAGGFIVRTAAAGATDEELRADIRFLKNLWTEIKARSESSKSPALIYHDLNVVERVLRDQVSSDFSVIWVDTEQEYERILRFANRFQPGLVKRVKLYTKETPLYDQFGLNEEINKALKSKVWLKSGGYIVINQTEALVAIDVNTGKYVGKTARLEDTIVKTNVDAIKEIVRQVRLRDLGGIIIIDFIDMDERRNRQKVMQALEEALRLDRAPSKVLQFNDFGLVAITRKRVKQSLERTIGTPCPYCQSTGFVKSVNTVCNEVYVEMRKISNHLEHSDVMLRVNPEVAKALKLNNAKLLNEMEELTKKTIIVKSDPALHQEQFDIH
jgi:ribonuclease G